jgi:predicted LPLAT superfamily acyltransferase
MPCSNQQLPEGVGLNQLEVQHRLSYSVTRTASNGSAILAVVRLPVVVSAATAISLPLVILIPVISVFVILSCGNLRPADRKASRRVLLDMPRRAIEFAFKVFDPMSVWLFSYRRFWTGNSATLRRVFILQDSLSGPLNCSFIEY